MEFEDKSLTCMDCSQDFLFTAGEQEFYERKGFKEIPKRCKPCRDARKTRRPDGGGGGGGGGNGVGRSLGGPRGEADGNRAPRSVNREMFEATCARCNGPARVPFRPVASRPVYCRDCYGQVGPTGGER